MTHHSLPPQCVDKENQLLDLLEKRPDLIFFVNNLNGEDFYREANRERFKRIESDGHSFQSEVLSLSGKIRFMAQKRREVQDHMGAIQEIYERFGISSPGTDK